MNTKIIYVVCSVACASVPVTELAKLSTKIGVTCNRVWRGASLTDDGAAVQGGTGPIH